MTEIIAAILCIAILLYVLLGGADFGAGIVEIFTGRKGMNIISKAMAPVWEANHIWIILAVVILFNGYPRVFTVITTYLHIPLLLVLTGIIIRGTTFTFRYYDTVTDDSRAYFTPLFRISSLLTPFFLGMAAGAIILGRIPASPGGTFYEVFISPWFNPFTLTTGMFLTLLCGWIAAVYLIGEAEEAAFRVFEQTASRLFILLIISGLLVFAAAGIYNLHLFQKFIHSAVSIVCVVVATVLAPVMWKSMKGRSVLLTRLLAGMITACILGGWIAAQFPVMVFMAGGGHLTVWNSQGPEKTMYWLLMALVAGILIIFPSFGYLFRIFKFDHDQQELKKD